LFNSDFRYPPPTLLENRMDDLITVDIDQTAVILDQIEVNVHSINDCKALLLVTEHGIETLHVVVSHDWVIFNSSPVNLLVEHVGRNSVIINVGIDTIH
jgi:hypothetical protein